MTILQRPCFGSSWACAPYSVFASSLIVDKQWLLFTRIFTSHRSHKKVCYYEDVWTDIDYIQFCPTSSLCLGSMAVCQFVDLFFTSSWEMTGQLTACSFHWSGNHAHWTIKIQLARCPVLKILVTVPTYRKSNLCEIYRANFSFHQSMPSAGIMVEPVFNAFATTAFFEFVLFAVFELRMILNIWRARRSQDMDMTVQRRELMALYIRFYLGLLISIILSYKLQR